MAKHTDAVNEELGQGAEVGITELGLQGGIEVVSERVNKKDIDLEAFMNEVLTICVFEDNQEGALDTVDPTVKGIKQVIVRGVNSKVRRKYVEVLARARSTKFTQILRDPTDRTSLAMKPSQRLVSPFTVIHDPNPKGRAWLKGILDEV